MPFKKYFNSGEINIPLPITNQHEYTNLQINILENLKNKYSDGKQSFLDGITVEYWDSPSTKLRTISDKTGNWWFNARFSNTESLVRVVVEANTEELMRIKKDELISEIKSGSEISRIKKASTQVGATGNSTTG